MYLVFTLYLIIGLSILKVPISDTTFVFQHFRPFSLRPPLVLYTISMAEEVVLKSRYYCMLHQTGTTVCCTKPA